MVCHGEPHDNGAVDGYGLMTTLRGDDVLDARVAGMAATTVVQLLAA